MPRPVKEKCRLCSKLTPAGVHLKHGPQGDNCWNPKVCHRRRNYHRHPERVNRQRRRARQGQQQALLTLPAPERPAAVIHLYRTRVGEPLHAIGAELWMGQTRLAMVEPVCALGWTGSQVKAYLRQVLQAFSQHQGVQLEKFEAQVELAPANCPIHPCPLRP